MRLLIVTQKVDSADSNLGFFINWVERFAKYTDITVIANEIGRYNLPENVRVFSLGKEKGVSRIVCFIRYQRFLIQNLPIIDGVFFHMCPEYVLGAHLLPRFFEKRTMLWYVHKKISWKLWLAEKLVDKIFTSSKESFRLKSEKVEIVGHGIDTELFNVQPLFTKELNLITVGRISPVKDLKTIIEGFLELKKKYSEATLSIIGDALIERDRVYRNKLALLFSARVRFIGSISYHELPKVYEDATAFVHASKTGSTDKAVLEALAAGLPVFTSSEAFSAEIPGVFTFRQGDPMDLAKKIHNISLRGRIGYNAVGREWVKQHHGLDRLIKKILSMFQD